MKVISTILSLLILISLCKSQPTTLYTISSPGVGESIFNTIDLTTGSIVLNESLPISSAWGLLNPTSEGVQIVCGNSSGVHLYQYSVEYNEVKTISYSEGGYYEFVIQPLSYDTTSNLLYQAGLNVQKVNSPRDVSLYTWDFSTHSFSIHVLTNTETLGLAAPIGSYDQVSGNFYFIYPSKSDQKVHITVYNIAQNSTTDYVVSSLSNQNQNYIFVTNGQIYVLVDFYGMKFTLYEVTLNNPIAKLTQVYSVTASGTDSSNSPYVLDQSGQYLTIILAQQTQGTVVYSTIDLSTYKVVSTTPSVPSFQYADFASF